MQIYIALNVHEWEGNKFEGESFCQEKFRVIGVFATPELAAEACVAGRYCFCFSGDWPEPKTRPEWQGWYTEKYPDVYIERWNVKDS